MMKRCALLTYRVLGVAISCMLFMPERSSGSEAVAVQQSPGLHEAAGRHGTDPNPSLRETVLKATQSASREQGALQAENPVRVQLGDLVRVNYTARLEDGTLVRTTSAEVASDPSTRKVPNFPSSVCGSPAEIIAGGESDPPGLGESVLGMGPGEKRHVDLPSEKAYGPPDPRMVARMPRTKTMGRTVRLSPQEYIGRLNSFPIQGQTVSLLPYFDGKVVAIKANEATVQFEPQDGRRFQDDFGETVVQVKDDSISLTLTPTVGALFEVQARKGTITGFDDTTFTVDFNDIVKGKAIGLEIEVVSLTKASAYRDMSLEWNQNHDEGLSLARASNKESVLVLYADWCKYCEKLFEETLQDPRVRMVKDRFVWIKVNSDRETLIKEKYGQKGFPLILVLNPEGQVLRKIDGFRDAPGLLDELSKV